MINDFHYLCNLLSNFCVLTIPLCTGHFELQIDASGKGLRGVFSDGVELPVAFYSWQLRGAETRYSASELKCLAVVDSVRHFQVYLHGRSFLVQADHKALQSLLSSTMLNGKLTR